MLEEIGWFLLWVLILIGVHYQFKICIPTTIWCLKIIESFLVLFMIKIYTFFFIYGDGFNLDIIKNTTVAFFKQYKDKLEL